MAPQTPTKHVSCHRKPGTTPLPSQAYMPTPSPSPSPMPISHPRKQQHHHHHHHHHHHDVRFDVAAVPSSISQSSRVQADSSSQLSTHTSSSCNSYTQSTSCPASLSGPPTLSRLEPSRTSPPKSHLESEVSSSSSSKPASQEAQTDQIGPPCNNCHQPSTLRTVGPLNPKGNAGRKYFACKRCPYGLAWVGWAGDSFGGVVVAVKDEGVASGPSDAGCAGGGSNVDGKKRGVSSPGSLSEEEADDRPRCCCGETMKLDYVDVSWDGAFYSPGEKTKTKKWFWTCTYGACGEFIWVEDTGGHGLAHHSGCKGEKRMGASVRILW